MTALLIGRNQAKRNPSIFGRKTPRSYAPLINLIHVSVKTDVPE